MVTLKDICRRNGIHEELAQRLFDSIMSTVLEDGEPVNVRGFGTFESRFKDAGVHKSPVVPDGEVHTPPQMVIEFKLSKGDELTRRRREIADKLVKKSKRGRPKAQAPDMAEAG